MKEVFLIVQPMFFSLMCLGQIFSSKPVNSGLNGSSNSVVRSVAEYSVDSCLYLLLRDVANADKKTYSREEMYYSLDFEPMKNSRYMAVTLERWKAARYLDYTGVLKVDSSFFLLTGNYIKDPIFSPVKGSGFFVELVPKDPNSGGAGIVEPSLQGLFTNCKGLPINLEIYIPETIPGYKLQIIQ